MVVACDLWSCGPSKEAKQAATNQLFEEVKVCNLPSVREQVRLGADVNGRRGNGGETPLMIAAQGGSLECVNFLLEKGATPDAKTDSGFTPLLFAARQQNGLVAEALLAKGAYVDMRDLKEGSTALITAASKGHTEVVQALLKRGARTDIEKAGSSGKSASALSEAACQYHFETAQALIAGGAKTDTRPVLACLERIRSELQTDSYYHGPDPMRLQKFVALIGLLEGKKGA